MPWKPSRFSRSARSRKTRRSTKSVFWPQSWSPMSSSTRAVSTTRTTRPCASLWSTQMGATSSTRSPKKINWFATTTSAWGLTRSIFGRWRMKYYLDWRPCTRTTSSTGISRVRIYSLWKELLNWGTWIFPKSLKMGFARRKRVPLTTPVQKSGKDKSITVSAISGRSAVSSMRWQRWGRPSRPMTFRRSIKTFSWGIILKLPWDTLRTSGSLSECVLLWIRVEGRRLPSCWKPEYSVAWNSVLRILISHKVRSTSLNPFSVPKCLDSWIQSYHNLKNLPLRKRRKPLYSLRKMWKIRIRKNPKGWK